MIGIIMSFHGIEPAWIASDDGRYLLLGHDFDVSAVDVSNGRHVATIALDGVFFEFARAPLPGAAIVLHELGVDCVGFAGTRIWCFSAHDIVTEFSVREDATAVLGNDSGRRVVLDLHDGDVVEVLSN
ncbi:MAG: hypothetical protein GX591_20630 [Planctomycetes bacterium]|nr:hypothetical protein [Planctomycetota bacterium]